VKVIVNALVLTTVLMLIHGVVANPSSYPSLAVNSVKTVITVASVAMTLAVSLVTTIALVVRKTK
jgi:amino acid transporter